MPFARSTGLLAGPLRALAIANCQPAGLKSMRATACGARRVVRTGTARGPSQPPHARRRRTPAGPSGSPLPDARPPAASSSPRAEAAALRCLKAQPARRRRPASGACAAGPRQACAARRQRRGGWTGAAGIAAARAAPARACGPSPSQARLGAPVLARVVAACGKPPHGVTCWTVRRRVCRRGDSCRHCGANSGKGGVTRHAPLCPAMAGIAALRLASPPLRTAASKNPIAPMPGAGGTLRARCGGCQAPFDGTASLRGIYS